MEFYSAKEIAMIWGISPRRVTVLAKNKRIPGAWQTGRNWMIPKDALKPADPRTDSAAAASLHSVCTIYLHRFDAAKNTRAALGHEEQQLYDAQEFFVHNAPEKADALLKTLVNTSSDRYILSGTYVMLCYCALERKDPALFDRYLLQLHLLCAEEFPAKNYLLKYLDELEAYCFADELRDGMFEPDYSDPYAAEFLPSIAVFSAYAELILQAKGEKKADTALLNLICAGFDRQKLYFSSQLIHTYLACISLLNGDDENCRKHAKAVLDLAVTFDSFYPPATAYRVLASVYEQLLPAYPDSAGQKLRARARNFTEGLELLTAYFSGKERIGLSQRDYEYLVLALRGLGNTEIAHLKGISEPTVSKYYSGLYRKFGVKNKKELISYLRR